MGLTTLLVRLATGAPVRCFVIVGAKAEAVAPWLRLDSGLVVVDSPRAADVLLVIGQLDDEMLRAAAAVHDAIPLPRGVVAWLPGHDTPTGWPFGEAVTVREPSEIAAACQRLRNQLVGGQRASSPDILPDVDPALWRGVGPFGQGGVGMTGGVPYGRPLAGRADDRDGLKLDQILVRVGPFLPPFPPSLVLDMRLQGDVIQEASIPAAAAADDPSPRGEGRSSVALGSTATDTIHAAGPIDPFIAALTRPVRVAELEVARARHHLAWLAEALRVSGLEAYGRRVLNLAFTVRPEAAEAVDALARWLRRNPSLRWGTSGVGVVAAARAGALTGGPVARASGDNRDTRSLDPAYQRLDFAPVVLEEGDALARWRLRVTEVQQSLLLAKRADACESTPSGLTEGPRGAIGAGMSASASLMAMLPDLLVGMEWGDAVTTVVSLDIDMTEVTLAHGVAAGSWAS